MVNNTLLVNDRPLLFFWFDLVSHLMGCIHGANINSNFAAQFPKLSSRWVGQSLIGNVHYSDKRFIYTRVEIVSSEMFLVTKLLMVDCSSWAGYWSWENACVRQSHSRWNSCQVDDSLQARSSIVFSNDFLYLTSTWLL